MTKADLAVVESAKASGDTELPAVHKCALLLSPGDDQPTQFGPMVIFGMPLFRKYAVQFDLTGDFEGKENRVMRFAEASHDCSGPVKTAVFRRKSGLQKVDLAKLRISPLQQRLMPNPDNGKFGLIRTGKETIRI